MACLLSFIPLIDRCLLHILRVAGCSSQRVRLVGIGTCFGLTRFALSEISCLVAFTEFCQVSSTGGGLAILVLRSGCRPGH